MPGLSKVRLAGQMRPTSSLTCNDVVREKKRMMSPNQIERSKRCKIKVQEAKFQTNLHAVLEI